VEQDDISLGTISFSMLFIAFSSFIRGPIFPTKVANAFSVRQQNASPSIPSSICIKEILYQAP
jgi:hypothetical protein